MTIYPRFIEVDDDGEKWEIAEGSLTLKGVHPEADCGGDNCVLHKPSDHHMRDWYLLWRDDRGIFERVCEHGIGHPDPDQSDYWKKTGQEYQGVHGCDGCCYVPEKPEKEMVEQGQINAYWYRMNQLLSKLHLSATTKSKSTLDEWETTAVASMIETWIRIGDDDKIQNNPAEDS